MVKLMFARTNRVARREVFFAITLLLLSTIIFGAGNVIQKAILTEVDMWMSLALRSAIAVVCLLPWAIAEFMFLWKERNEFLRLLPLPVLGFCAGIVLQVVGSAHTSATELGFLINLSAVFTTILCAFGGQCRVGIAACLACFLSLIGVALLGNGGVSSLGFGQLLCIGSALGYALWIIGVQRISSRYRCAALITCLQWVLPAVIGFAFTGRTLVSSLDMSIPALGQLIFLGVGTSVLAYFLAATAQAKLSAVTAALIYPAEAVFGAFFAQLWLGEALMPLGYIGALAILLAIIIVSVPAESLEPVFLRLEKRSIRRNEIHDPNQGDRL